MAPAEVLAAVARLRADRSRHDELLTHAELAALLDAAELGARLLEIDSWHGISPPLKDAIGWADEDMERAREERGNG